MYANPSEMPVCRLRRRATLVLPGTILALWLAVLAAPSPAHARDRDFDLSLETGFALARSPSLDAVNADDNLASSRLLAGWRLTELERIGSLHLEAAYAYSATRARSFDQIDGELGLHSFQAGARLVRPLASRLTAHVRLLGGLTLGSLSLVSEDTTEPQRVSDQDLGVGLYAGAGLELLLNPHPQPGDRMRWSFRLETGWTQVQSLGFVARPDEPDDGVSRLPSVSASLGALDPSGLAFHAGVVLTF